MYKNDIMVTTYFDIIKRITANLTEDEKITSLNTTKEATAQYLDSDFSKDRGKWYKEKQYISYLLSQLIKKVNYFYYEDASSPGICRIGDWYCLSQGFGDIFILDGCSSLSYALLTVLLDKYEIHDNPMKLLQLDWKPDCSEIISIISDLLYSNGGTFLGTFTGGALYSDRILKNSDKKLVIHQLRIKEDNIKRSILNSIFYNSSYLKNNPLLILVDEKGREIPSNSFCWKFFLTEQHLIPYLERVFDVVHLDAGSRIRWKLKENSENKQNIKKELNELKKTKEKMLLIENDKLFKIIT